MFTGLHPEPALPTRSHQLHKTLPNSLKWPLMTHLVLNWQLTGLVCKMSRNNQFWLLLSQNQVVTVKCVILITLKLGYSEEEGCDIPSYIAKISVLWWHFKGNIVDTNFGNDVHMCPSWLCPYKSHPCSLCLCFLNLEFQSMLPSCDHVLPPLDKPRCYTY